MSLFWEHCLQFTKRGWWSKLDVISAHLNVQADQTCLRRLLASMQMCSLYVCLYIVTIHSHLYSIDLVQVWLLRLPETGHIMHCICH